MECRGGWEFTVYAEGGLVGLDEASGEGCEVERAAGRETGGRVRVQHGQARLMGCRTIALLRVGYAAPFM